MHTIKFQFVEKAAEEKVDLFFSFTSVFDLFTRLWQKTTIFDRRLLFLLFHF